MIAFLLLAGLAYASAVPVDQCSAGEWSAWSECISSKHCPQIETPLFTWPMEVTDEWDEGRDTMTDIMKKKLESWRQTDACIADGSCPELLRQPIPGSHDCVDGIAGDLPCLNVHQHSFLNFDQLGYNPRLPGDAGRGNDVWGWEDPSNGREYVIAGLSGGTSFVDVTDPKNPVTIGFMYSATVHSSWRDMKVIGNYAYIVAEAADHGLQVFDLRRLRGQTTGQVFLPDATLKTFGQAHNIVSNSDTNYVYVVGATRTTGAGGAVYSVCRGGLLVVDVRNPLAPTQVGCFGDDGYVHDAQCVIYHGPHVAYQNREICFCFNENSLTIVDVNDKNNMFVIGKTAYINVAYTHQGWLTEDHECLLLDDEQDETREPASGRFTKTYVWDVINLNTPILKSIYEASVRSIDHNQYIIGDYTFQGNYESGLRILHINRQTYQLTTVGYLDVYPTGTTAAFNGVWSVYPYFRSKNIAIQSINHGLFMAHVDWSAIEALVAAKVTPAEQTRTRSIFPAFNGATCPAAVETKTCNATVQC